MGHPHQNNLRPHILTFGFAGALLMIPGVALAYGQSYYQSYYESYYQSYYQTYYQSSYGLEFTKNTNARSSFTVSGNISKGSGSFVIDHPLYPKDMLLYHSFVESPDVKNLYDGVVTLDTRGEATVMLPVYFEVLNNDFRYQVKPIGVAMPNLHILQEVRTNRFVIGGGVPGGKVSWQITGIRRDPYIVANPIVPEVEKGPDALADKGEYVFEGNDPGSIGSLSPWFDALLRSLFSKD